LAIPQVKMKKSIRIKLKNSTVFLISGILSLILFSCKKERESGQIVVSENKRFFATASGEPFFWLGDTGWLLPSKLNRDEAEIYLTDRKQKGFNVIQVMVLHEIKAVNAYGDSAIINRNVATPATTEGSAPEDPDQYDYWDHLDFIVNKAGGLNLYMAMVPVWGSNVKAGYIDVGQAKAYGKFLTDRYKGKHNIIWLNGGDIKGTDGFEVWQALGAVLHEHDSSHLTTFHPRGRTPSSQWFHNEQWLDFNMFQSGHRTYEQDTSKTELRYGEDNWRYVNVDYAKQPIKPTVDGEPSYEGIPHGLHDTTQARWTDDDVRRYGYWSVFAGGAGYTYGHNSVMQMYKPTDQKRAYGAKGYWFDEINAAGATQMIFLKDLMLSRPYFERVPDQSLIVDQGTRYDYIVATRGIEYAFIYTYTGRNFKVNTKGFKGEKMKATWFDPRTGATTEGGETLNSNATEFDPPGSPEAGNDWVLILDAI
jgi:hypothetical protein